MIKLVGLRAKSYSYVMDDGGEDKKAKGTLRKLEFENYKNCLEATRLQNKIIYQKK